MLKGLRFQKRIRLLPGVRINLSKSGASASVGPRGADVKIGRSGVTTHAGIPGTGVSYRRRIGGRHGWIGALTLLAGLAVWGWQNRDAVAAYIGQAAKPTPANITPAQDRQI